MTLLESFNNLIDKKFYKIKKYSPEIKFGIGMASGAVAIGTSAYGAIKVEHAIQDYNDIMDELDESELTKKEFKSEKRQAKIDLTKNVAKAVAPAVISTVSWGVNSMSGFLEERDREKKALATVGLMSATIMTLRQRIRDEYGEEAENKIYFGYEEADVTDLNDDATVDIHKERHISDDIKGLSPYALIIGKYRAGGGINPYWEESGIEYTLNNLVYSERRANDLLQSRGHLFLNEVLTMIGEEHTQAGAVVGWVLGNGDNHVDFHLELNQRNDVKNFFKGEECILVDFNVDGVIYDLI